MEAYELQQPGRKKQFCAVMELHKDLILKSSTLKIGKTA